MPSRFSVTVFGVYLLPVMFATWVAFMILSMAAMFYYKQATTILAECNAPTSIACMSAEVVTAIVGLPLAWINGALILLVFVAAFIAAQVRGADEVSPKGTRQWPR